MVICGSHKSGSPAELKVQASVPSLPSKQKTYKKADFSPLKLKKYLKFKYISNYSEVLNLDEPPYK